MAQKKMHIKENTKLLSELKRIGRMKGYKSLDKYLADKYLQQK